MTAFNAKIMRIALLKTKDLATALGYTIDEGDLITDAMILAASGLGWRQLAVAGDITEHAWITEPLTQEQFAKYTRDDITTLGFETPEGNITKMHYPGFSTFHTDLLETCFGKKILNSGNADVIDGDFRKSLTINTVGLNITSDDIGRFVEIGGYISVIESVATNTITLKSKVTAKNGDTIVVQSHWDTDIINDDSYIMYVETQRGARLISHVRFGLDFETPERDLLKLKFNYQGDVALKSVLTWNDVAATGTMTYEDNSKDMTTTHFKQVTLGDPSNKCLSSFKFTLEREMTRLTGQATESMQGNCGTYKQVYKTSVEVRAYDYILGSEYNNNTYFMILAQKPGFAIYAPVSQVNSENPNIVNDKASYVTYMLSANVGQSQADIVEPAIDLTKTMYII